MEKGEVDLCGVTGENEEETMGMKNRSGFSWREKPCLQMEPVRMKGRGFHGYSPRLRLNGLVSGMLAECSLIARKVEFND